jgi:dihydropteroate synthase
MLTAGKAPADAIGTLPSKLPETARVYLKPVALLQGETATAAVESGQAFPLAGGPLAFAGYGVAIRVDGQIRRSIAAVAEIDDWTRRASEPVAKRIRILFDRLTRRRPDALARPSLMGIVNVTPDSFSDAGEHLNPEAAISHALTLARAGADILDIGGESTRPGAEPTAVETELRRVMPVLQGLARARSEWPGLLLSIDTRHSAVMRQAIELGVDIINDVSALSDDPDSLGIAAASDARVVLTHKQGQPSGMNVAPQYNDVVLDVFDHLEARIEACAAAGIDRSRLIVDPGIGFGKRTRENLAVLGSLSLYHGLGCPLLLGISRKALIGGEQKRLAPKDRLPGSLAAAVHAFDRGVQLLRVHDVAETRQVVDLWSRINLPDG